jgi:hypothetical protein
MPEAEAEGQVRALQKELETSRQEVGRCIVEERWKRGTNKVVEELRAKHAKYPMANPFSI